MVIDTKTKVKTRNNNKHHETMKMNIDYMTYNILCRYVLQSSKLVRLEHIKNLGQLIYAISPTSYENDSEKEKMVRFIMKGVEARLEHNLTDRDLILTYINGGLSFQVDFLDYNKLDLSKKEIQWVHQLIAEILRYQFVTINMPKLQDIMARWNKTDFANRGSIVQEIENEIDLLKAGFRKSRIEDNINDVTFSLREGRFESAITDTWNIVSSPSRRLMTGMQGLNEMIGGGFESGRVYMFLGTSGVGKSITLLNLLYQMKMYNNKFVGSDPTKTPCIVMLTMENTVVETLTRLFDMIVDNSHGMQNYDINDVIRMLRNQGKLVLSDSSPIDIVIRFKPNRSIDTDYLYTLVDDLDDDGYEPVCIIQDHVKRIRSRDMNPDLRLELGDVVNEFKVFASEKQIPLITVSHLNREATRVVEEASRKGNQDNGKLLGKSNIGESLLMIDNIDCAITLSKDYDKDGNCYMTFHRIKMRDKGSSRDYIAQPFVQGNEIRLIEDLWAPTPQFKESLHNNDINNRANRVAISAASALTGDIDISNEFNMDDDDDFGNSFSKTTYGFEVKEENYNQIGATSDLVDSLSVVQSLTGSLPSVTDAVNNGTIERIAPPVIPFTIGEPYQMEITYPIAN